MMPKDEDVLIIDKLMSEVLGHFDWGKSNLSAEDIRILNECHAAWERICYAFYHEGR